MHDSFLILTAFEAYSLISDRENSCVLYLRFTHQPGALLHNQLFDQVLHSTMIAIYID